MREPGRVIALLGDVVGSRRDPAPDSRRRMVGDALDLANERLPALQFLTPTIGDEFQGLFGDIVSAVQATLIVRLALLEEVDVRFGIGSGEIFPFDPSKAPFQQDGPAWWAAREAVDAVRGAAQRQEMPRGVRTRWVGTEGDPPLLVAAVNAHLQCRDELVASMDRRDATTMLGLFDGRPLGAIADRIGVTVSALSQRAIRGGLYAIRRAQEELEGASP